MPARARRDAAKPNGEPGLIKLKPIDQQVVVVFAASSGIGRETALRFARRGAKLVVAARSREGLSSLVDEIGRSARGFMGDC